MILNKDKYLLSKSVLYFLLFITVLCPNLKIISSSHYFFSMIFFKIIFKPHQVDEKWKEMTYIHDCTECTRDITNNGL